MIIYDFSIETGLAIGIVTTIIYRLLRFVKTHKIKIVIDKIQKM